MTQLANRLATASVLSVVEEPLRPRATSALELAVDEDLGMDNRAEGVANARRNACDFEGIEETWPHTAGTPERFNSTPIGEESGRKISAKTLN